MTNSRYQNDCFYCEHNDVQKERMIEIMPLHVSTCFLNRDQTHPGRCVVALNRHANEMFELSDAEKLEFIKDVSLVAKIIKEKFHASKINYGIYGDTVSHLHFHLVPKNETDIDWDDTFINNPKNPKKLSDEEYNKIAKIIEKELEKNYEEIRN